MEYSLKPLTLEYLTIVLTWRNSDRIRKNMYNEKIITLKEHQRWFQSISKSNKDIYLLFFINNKPTGLVCFNKVDHDHCHCVWGFYIGDTNAPKGAGTVMGILGMNYAFHCLKLNKVYGEVLADNKPSLLFHEKLGFRKEGEFKQHIKKEKGFIDTIIFALYKKDWLNLYHLKNLNSLLEKGIELNEKCMESIKQNN